MTAYYNEHDAYAAHWLRNLIAAGHIAPGDVDERDIKDVRPDEIRGYTQCHFFAGIGVWSHALRRAGWADDRPIWTGSCPCQPFSAAGGRAGVADERHLWPHWFHLVEQCRPPVVLGEQVASKDGLGWLDLVSDDLEGARYAFAASDLCAAGFSGAHIRQRLYFVGVADTYRQRRTGQHALLREEAPRWNAGYIPEAAGSGEDGGLALPDSGQRQRLADGEECQSDGAQTGRIESDGAASPSSDLCGLGHPDSDRTRRNRRDGDRSEAKEYGAGVWINGPLGHGDQLAGTAGDTHAPMLGRHPADWLFCRDGKWRPVEPGTFPLVDAAPARVGRLRAYGNGLDAETATGFVTIVMEIV